MNYLKRIKLRHLLFHAILWIAVWFFYVYFFSYNTKDVAYITWFSSWLLPLTIIATYTMVYYLIPNYLLTKKYLLFALYNFYLFVFTSYSIVLIIFGGFVFLSWFDISTMPPMGKNYAFILILVYLVIGLVCFVNLLNQNFQAISINKELRNKMLTSQLQLKEQELHYLKMQIHPHFLFNTLNTIYGFALKQSKYTPELILKLSNLLDYILYQVNKPKVSLKEEVLHIKEYIELEKIRFQDTLKVIFSSNDISENVEIAPMLLIPFVENAFKHGNITDGFLKVEIKVMVNDNSLDFTIRNTVLTHQKNVEKNGIGLVNTIKRLDLYYVDNYHLEKGIRDNWFTVNLLIFRLNEIKNV